MSKDKSQQNLDKSSLPMRQMREELGMTQVQFAIAIGVDPGTISRAERGVTEPTFTALQFKNLCSLTKRSIDEIPDYLGKDILSKKNSNGSTNS